MAILNVVNVEVNGQVAWRVWRSGKRFIAECEPLGVAVEADSSDQLPGLIGETTHLLMVDLLRDNELDAFLRQRGWQATGVPKNHDQEVLFNVPWQIIAANNGRDPAQRPH